MPYWALSYLKKLSVKSKLLLIIMIVLGVFAIFNSVFFTYMMTEFSDNVVFSELSRAFRITKNKLEQTVLVFSQNAQFIISQKHVLQSFASGFSDIQLQDVLNHADMDAVASVENGVVNWPLFKDQEGYFIRQNTVPSSVALSGVDVQQARMPEKLQTISSLIQKMEDIDPGVTTYFIDGNIVLLYRHHVIVPNEDYPSGVTQKDIVFIRFIKRGWLQALAIDLDVNMFISDRDGVNVIKTSSTRFAPRISKPFEHERSVQTHEDGIYCVYGHTFLTSKHNEVLIGVFMPDTRFLHRVNRATVFVLLFSVLLLVLLVVFTRKVLGGLIAPVSKLAVAATRLAEGDFESTILCSGNDEVGQLAASFEKMRHNLKISFEEIFSTECRLRGFIDKTLEGVFKLDVYGKLVDANPAMARMFGYDGTSRFLRSPFQDFLKSFRHEVRGDAFLSCLRDGHAISGFEVLFQTRDGADLWGRLSAVPIKNENNEFCGIEGHIEDVTDRIIAYKALRKAKDELEIRVVERTSQLVEVVNVLEHRSEQAIRVNTMSAQLQASSNMGELCAAVNEGLSGLFPNRTGALYIIVEDGEQLVNVVEFGEASLRKTTIDAKDCRAFDLQGKTGLRFEKEDMCEHCARSEAFIYCIPLRGYDAVHGVLQLCGSEENEEREKPYPGVYELAVDVADHIALAVANIFLREKLLQQNVRDPLTGLYNRRHLKEVIDREGQRARRHNRTVGVIFIDIDKFKSFNDTYGHDAGDYILYQIGSFLLHNIREEDTVFRYGGEEFLMLLPEIDLKHLVQRAEALRKAVRQLSFQYKTKDLGKITISVGVSLFPFHGRTLNDVILLADDLLLKAKTLGRDRVISPDMEFE